MQGQKCFNDKRLLFFIGTQCQRPSGGKMDPNSTKVVRNRSQGNLFLIMFQEILYVLTYVLKYVQEIAKVLD